ncbi:MAG TPA: ABC transporter substrate-binding protein [Thermomicrobiales bacterium]|nr:ABC transporter substrate-binding protein [Thermomicrobiales bacterium]
MHSPSRRALLRSSGILVAGTALASTTGSIIAQGDATATPAASPAASPASSDGTWTFTDDRGVTVTLPQRPERIFADLSAAAPLWDFGIRPLAVTGWTVTTDAAWGNVDRSTPNILDNAESGMPNLEKLIALKPDIYVNITWSKGDPTNVWGFPDAEAIARVEEIVPMVCIAATGLADESMERFAELSALLGADLNAPEIVAAKEAYDAAVETFSTTASEKADLTSLFAYVSPDPAWYAASPRDWADLAWYQKLGMTIVEPEAEPGAYWQELSKEQALLYPSDIFFNSTRDGVLSPDDLKSETTFANHPAIAAGQIGAWNQDFIMSYQGLTAALETMIGVLSSAQKVS